MQIIGKAACAALLLLGSGAIAQGRNEGRAQQGGSDPSKFFVFYLEGVSYQQARSDYLYCIRLA